MPIYEYECSAGHRFEKREGFDAPATRRCAQCRRIARRVLHAASIVFKGSGFYVTDSRKAPPADSESKSEPSGDTSATKEKTPSESAAHTSTTKEKTSTKDAEAAAAG